MHDTFKTMGLKMRVLHFPQIPCKPFIVDVKDEFEAYKIVITLAEQHLWLFRNKFIPDYSNVITVQMFCNEENDWVDYYHDDLYVDFDQLVLDFEHQFKPKSNI